MSELNERNTTETKAVIIGLIASTKFCRETGISPVTAWRYARAGWLKPVKIANKVFFRRSDLAEFEARAAAGEFAKPASGVASPMNKAI